MRILFDPPLIRGTLVKRYKRFLVDVELENQRVITAHCPNSGAMLGINQPNMHVWLQPTPHTKLPFKLQFVEVDGLMVGANTHNANLLVESCLTHGFAECMPPFASFRREVRYGSNSRIDFLVTHSDGSLEYIEVKNVHYQDQGVAMFPDSHSVRATKHLHELIEVIRQGHKATVIFIVQRSDCRSWAPASHIDPDFGKALNEAYRAGVRLLAFSSRTSQFALELSTAIPISLERRDHGSAP